MPEGDDLIRREVKAVVFFMVSGVARKDAHHGPGSEFVWSGGRTVWVPFATKDTEVIVHKAWLSVGKVRVLVGKMLRKEVVVERASTQDKGGREAWTLQAGGNKQHY